MVPILVMKLIIHDFIIIQSFKCDYNSIYYICNLKNIYYINSFLIYFYFYIKKKKNRYFFYIKMNNDASDIIQESINLIEKTTSIIKSLNSNNNESQLNYLSIMIPKLDDIILQYKPFFPDSIQICDDDQFVNIANKTINLFLRNRKETILKMYQKTFEHYHHVLDELTSQIVKITMSLNAIKENSSTGFENQLSELKQQFEAEYEKIRENHNKQLEELNQKMDQKINGIGSKIGDEDQRLTQHYEKILKSKTESLQMTESAYEKAKNEVDETTSSAKKEIDSIVTKNNEILKEYNKSVMSNLVDEEKKVKELEEKVETITTELNKIAPIFNKKWEEREKELLTKFKEEDDQFALKKLEKDSLLRSTEKQIEEYNQAMNNIQSESQDTIEKSKNELEKKLQEKIQNRQNQIDQEVKLRKEKYKAKIRLLKESLQKLNKQSKTDEDAMKGRIQDKLDSHQDRIKKIKDDQTAFLLNIQKEINDTKEEYEKVKIEWEEERNKIENSSKEELAEIQNKIENSNKYFELKFEALRKELHHVLQDNAKIFNMIAKDNDDLLSLKLKHKEEEAEFSSKIQQKMKTESDLKIQQKIEELKAKHSAEREKLKLEIQTAGESESGLELKYKNALNESKSQPDRIFNQFSKSDIFEEMNEKESNKWNKTEFLEGLKDLKNEEKIALEQLFQSRDEFKEAVDKALVLHEKLTETSKFYKEEVEKAKEKNEEQLNDLRQTIGEKQKELKELEFQFDENEKELNKKARLVEKAEDRLNDLRKKLSKEKDLIRQKIISDYQPLISKELEKSQLMVREITEITENLQNSINWKKHELELIEASNNAMIEGIRKETSEKVELFKEKLDEDLRESEAVFIDDLIKKEEELMKNVNEKMASFKLEEDRIEQELKDKLMDQQEFHKSQIDSLNEDYMKIVNKNCEKKEKISQLSNAECQNCFVLKKSIKKIEKQLITMQEEERDLTLADKNHNETYKTFNNNLRKTLPPLRKY